MLCGMLVTQAWWCIVRQMALRFMQSTQALQMSRIIRTHMACTSSVDPWISRGSLSHRFFSLIMIP